MGVISFLGPLAEDVNNILSSLLPVAPFALPIL